MATLSHTDIAKAIHLTLREDSGATAQVVNFLAKRKMLSKSEAILSKLEDIVNEEQGLLKGIIYSSEKIDEKIKREIMQNLEKKYQGKKIFLEEKIKEGLLGGYKIEIGGEVIDLSIQNKIKKLQEHLTRNI